jgi:translation initiation factor IF-3
VPSVRLVDETGENVGVVATEEAIRRAEAVGLDLVEVANTADPPVCKILDYGKFKYEEKKRKRDTKRKQSVVEIKEIKLRPKTDEHDLDFKMRAARRFIEAGNKVKFTVRFRGREITHPEKAREQLDWISSQCTDLALIETRPMMEARTMSMIIAPKTAVLQKLADTRAQQEKERKEAEQARRAAKGGKGSVPGADRPDPDDELDELEDKLEQMDRDLDDDDSVDDAVGADEE